MPIRVRGCKPESHRLGALLAALTIGGSVAVGACQHASPVLPEPDPIVLTVRGSDSTLLAVMGATAGDFGGTGRADPAARTWRSSVIQVEAGAAFGFHLLGVPPGTTVITAQIADTTGGLRRVVFQCTVQLAGSPNNQRRLTVGRAALRVFAGRFQRRLVLGP